MLAKSEIKKNPRLTISPDNTEATSPLHFKITFEVFVRLYAINAAARSITTVARVAGKAICAEALESPKESRDEPDETELTETEPPAKRPARSTKTVTIFAFPSEESESIEGAEPAAADAWIEIIITIRTVVTSSPAKPTRALISDVRMATGLINAL